MFRRLPVAVPLIALPTTLLIALLTLTGCTSEQPAPSRTPTRITVAAAFYPLAWMVERLGGNLVEVHDLTPTGAEPHDLELDADGVDTVDGADLAVVMGRGFQPSVEAAAAHRRGPTVTVLDELLPGSGEVGDEGSRAGIDPHVWLDPVMFARLVAPLERRLAAADPAHAESFRVAAERLTGDLSALDGDYRSRLANCAHHDLVTSHSAFGRLASRYGLHQIGIAGLSPDAEPDPRRLAAITDRVKASGATTVFIEELLPAQLGSTLARETGASTASLSALESLTAAERSAGSDYLSVMRSNLAAISDGLSCGG